MKDSGKKWVRVWVKYGLKKEVLKKEHRLPVKKSNVNPAVSKPATNS